MKGTTNAQQGIKKFFAVPDYANKTVIATSGWTTERTIANTGFLQVRINGSPTASGELKFNGVTQIESSYGDTTNIFITPIESGVKIKGSGTPQDFDIWFVPIKWIEIGGGGLNAALRRFFARLTAPFTPRGCVD